MRQETGQLSLSHKDFHALVGVSPVAVPDRKTSASTRIACIVSLYNDATGNGAPGRRSSASSPSGLPRGVVVLHGVRRLAPRNGTDGRHAGG